MKGIRAIAMLGCLLAADGSRSYGNNRVKGATCTVISTFREQRPARSGAATGAGGTPPAAASTGTLPASIHANPPATFMSGSGDAGAPGSAAGGTTASAPAASGLGTAASAPLTPIEAVNPSPPARPGKRLQQGQIYSYILDGVRHYSSKPPKGVAGVSAMRTIKYSFLETCFACAPNTNVNFGTLRLNTVAYEAEIRAASRAHGVDEAIVRAIIHAESAFNPRALSRVGAQGLMQLMPATARRFGVGDPFDAGQNIQGGVQYLAWLLKRFNGNLTLAAAGYNAGEGAVDRYKGVPPYSETQLYVQRVAVLAERYRGSAAAAAR